MIRHIVLFDFAKEAEGRTAIENAVIAKDMFLNLPEKIDVLRRIEVGINDADADETNSTLCLVCDFDSMEDLQIYQNHPEHLKVGSFIGKVKTQRSCVDYEI